MTAKPKRRAQIGVVVGANVQYLPPSIAASVGKTINRFAIMEVTQLLILKRLLGISVKEARIAIRVPRSRMYVGTVKLLLAFLNINVSTKWAALQKALEKADSARNALAHSVFVKPTGAKGIQIQLTSSTWDLGNEFEPVHRALIPEGKVVNRQFLMEQRRHVEAALKLIRQLERESLVALRSLNERRRTEPALDRRRPSS